MCTVVLKASQQHCMCQLIIKHSNHTLTRHTAPSINAWFIIFFFSSFSRLCDSGIMSSSHFNSWRVNSQSRALRMKHIASTYRNISQLLTYYLSHKNTPHPYHTTSNTLHEKQKEIPDSSHLHKNKKYSKTWCNVHIANAFTRGQHIHQ